MKKTIALLLGILMLCGCFTLAGCGSAPKIKEAVIAKGVTAQYDKKALDYSDGQFSAKDGAWYLVIHVCDSKDDFNTRKTYFANTLTSIVYTDVKAEDAELGGYTYQSETHPSGEQMAASYFMMLDAPVRIDSITKVFGIYCYLSYADDAQKQAAEEVIATLSIGQV